MSVEVPKLAVNLGGVGVPQGDIIEAKVHLGATKEVSSWELLLQNWDGKYSPSGAYPLSVGMDGYICIGRGANVPQIITTRTESIEYASTPAENYVRVSGRCWGEKLFRRVVTKTYENQKGETIVKDLLDYYAGLSHVRGGAELVEDTDTTYTKLEYTDTPLWDILKYVAESSDKNGVIGYDFRVAADGKFEFFPQNSKSSPVSLSEKIEQSEYRRDIHRVRNKIMIYGIADKSVPADKDSWTESLTPADGVWTATSGVVSFDTAKKARGTGSIKLYAQNLYYGSALFTLNAGKEVDCNLYPSLEFLAFLEKTFNGNVTIQLYDTSSREAKKNLTVAPDEWRLTSLRVGVGNAGDWEEVAAGFDWMQVKQVRVSCDFSGAGTGSFWVDGLYFGGRRYAAVREDAASQTAYGLRELTETDEELWSDNECDLRAKALLAYLKDPAEYLTVSSAVIDYGSAPILPGDKIHVELPNENVDSDFRIESVEYKVDAKTQTLEITLELGKVPPQMADYLYGLRTFTVNVEKLSRTKLGKKGIPSVTQSGGVGSHHVAHEYGDASGQQWPGIDDGGWDPLNGWIGPAYIGPSNDAAAIVYFRTRNKAGTVVLDHQFVPLDDLHGVLGSETRRWLEANINLARLGSFHVGNYEVISSSRVLQNVTADAGIITSGQFPLARLPRSTAGYVLEAEGAGYDPMYVDPNYRYSPKSHVHSEHTGIGPDDHHARDHNHAGETLSPNQVSCNSMSIAVSCNRQYTHPSAQQCVYASSVAWENCPRFYAPAAHAHSCANSGECGTIQDAVFANDFRITEAETIGLGHGLAFLNQKNNVLMVLTEDGDLHLKGKIKALQVKKA